MTKKELKHCKGIEEIDHHKKKHLHNGRSCKNCKKKQYLWAYWESCGWQNVL